MGKHRRNNGGAVRCSAISGELSPRILGSALQSARTNPCHCYASIFTKESFAVPLLTGRGGWGTGCRTPSSRCVEFLTLRVGPPRPRCSSIFRVFFRLAVNVAVIVDLRPVLVDTAATVARNVSTPCVPSLSLEPHINIYIKEVLPEASFAFAAYCVEYMVWLVARFVRAHECSGEPTRPKVEEINRAVPGLGGAYTGAGFRRTATI